MILRMSVFLCMHLITRIHGFLGDAHPPGHMMPLGTHTLPEEVDIQHKIPPSYEFYIRYAKKGKPLILQDILRYVNFDAFWKWNDTYLGQKFARYIMNVESMKPSDAEPHNKYVRMDQFLDNYLKDDFYMVHSIHSSMKDDITIPPLLQCGGFQNTISNARLWMSGGEMVTPLTYQEYDQFYCQTDGGSSWILVSPDQENFIKHSNYDHIQRQSKVDPDHVDMFEFPSFRYIKWTEAVLSAGDCLFVPQRWFQQLRSAKGRSQAVEFSLTHIPWFNISDCVENEALQWKTLSKYKYMSEIEQKRFKWLQHFDGMPFVEIKDIEDLRKMFRNSDWPQLIQFFRLCDRDRDMLLTWEELLSFNIKFAAERLSALFKDEDEDDTYDAASKHYYKADVHFTGQAQKLHDALHDKQHDEL